MNQDRIVATFLVTREENEGIYWDYFLVEGPAPKEWDKHTWGNYKMTTLEIPITEAQLLTMNSFLRNRWEKAREDIREKYAHKNPFTPDQCYEGPRTDQ